KAIDPTLEKAALADHTRQSKIVAQFESRLRRIEKTKFDLAVTTIREAKDKLFPKNGLQERSDNFLNIYLEEGQAMLDVLIEALDPLREGMVVVR
ncbi:MAG: bacillithiol biosynthesis BshC, partial [Bacteroidota bacterium]